MQTLLDFQRLENNLTGCFPPVWTCYGLENIQAIVRLGGRRKNLTTERTASSGNTKRGPGQPAHLIFRNDGPSTPLLGQQRYLSLRPVFLPGPPKESELNLPRDLESRKAVAPAPDCLFVKSSSCACFLLRTCQDLVTPPVNNTPAMPAGQTPMFEVLGKRPPAIMIIVLRFMTPVLPQIFASCAQALGVCECECRRFTAMLHTHTTLYRLAR